MSEPTKSKKRMFALIMLVVSAVLGVVIVEVGLRVMASAGKLPPRPLPHEVLAYEPAVMARHVLPAKARTYTSGDRQFPINSRGYRGAEFEETKREGVIRVMVYGGSQVFDQNVSGAVTWVHATGRLLAGRGYRVEMINAGIPGHNSLWAVGRFIAEGHFFKPDVVVLINAWNDIATWTQNGPPLRTVATYRGDPAREYRGVIDELLCRHSRLYTAFRGRLLAWLAGVSFHGAPGGEQLDDFSRYGPTQYAANARHFVSVVRASGAVPLLTVQARALRPGLPEDKVEPMGLRFLRLQYPAALRAFEAADAAVRQVGLASAVTVVDLNRAFPSTDGMFTDGIHTTPAGSEVLSRTLADALAPIVGRLQAAEAQL